MDKWVNLWTNIIFDLRSTPFVTPLQGGPFQLSPDLVTSVEHRLHQAYLQQIFSLLVFSLTSNSCEIPQENPGRSLSSVTSTIHPCDLILNLILNLVVRTSPSSLPPCWEPALGSCHRARRSGGHAPLTPPRDAARGLPMTDAPMRPPGPQ